MQKPLVPKSRRWIQSLLLLGVLVLIGAGLAAWKFVSIRKSIEAGRHQPELMESVSTAVAVEREYTPTTVSIGTVLALRSISLRNELPGTVRQVALNPGEIVEAGTVLVALDVSVEEAELKAQEAQATLAESTLRRLTQLIETRATSETDVDRARSERDVALAQIARTKAIIERRTIRAPFRSRVGLSDVHVGQYLEEGAHLTTLQGVDDAVNVDFTVPQRAAEALHEGERVDVLVQGRHEPVPATVMAIDARIDSVTRNAMVRARIEGSENAPAPGGSVRVRSPIGPPVRAVGVPVSALRKGPGGDHVFVIAADKEGKPRASLRLVNTGAVLGDEVLVLSGLTVGETVASDGSFKLRDAMSVVVAESKSGERPGSGGHGSR